MVKADNLGREDDCAEEKVAPPAKAGPDFIPAMNFLSNSRSMAVRLPSGLERLAERRSMLDKKLWELAMAVNWVRPRVCLKRSLLCHHWPHL